ncbi:MULTISPECIES: hypothetical protein [Trichocoleus]|uniref:Uncharacterized protein n=1 Tax=Trichocoleus desertorum GB2-A4 TaxID=2933944 RepID=A0ABV0JFG1_9CYAN|nr:MULTISPECIES: hypothetical protein [unclassified Trichocoleus]MBD1865561.1 hypothetical protein [Trichocoleus sp. FACHB-46]MBD2120299.1 hypothetical protein [Trichocoleus sp. FACHB-262]
MKVKQQRDNNSIAADEQSFFVYRSGFIVAAESNRSAAAHGLAVSQT